MLRIVCALTVALVLSFGPAAAQNYPSRQISIVVTFPPGGNADTIATADRRQAIAGVQADRHRREQTGRRHHSRHQRGAAGAG